MQIITHQLPAMQGLAQVLAIIKQEYLAQLIGIHGTNLKDYARGATATGKYKVLPPAHLEATNTSIASIAQMLMNTRITADDTLAQLKELGKVIRLTKFLQDEVGWSVRQIKMHVSETRSYCYGTFDSPTIMKINAGLAKYAILLSQIEVVQD